MVSNKVFLLVFVIFLQKPQHKQHTMAYGKTRYARKYKARHGIGKGAHNTLQSRPNNPAGLYPPELYTTLVTAWSTEENAYSMAVRPGHRSGVGAPNADANVDTSWRKFSASICPPGAIIPLATLRPCHPKDILRSTTSYAKGTTTQVPQYWDAQNCFVLNGNVIRPLLPHKNLNGLPNVVGIAESESRIGEDGEPLAPGATSTICNGAGQIAAGGYKCVGWDALSTIYARSLTSQCNIEVTLVPTKEPKFNGLSADAANFTGQTNGDDMTQPLVYTPAVLDGGTDRWVWQPRAINGVFEPMRTRCALNTIALAKLGGLVKVQYIWFGLSIVYQDESATAMESTVDKCSNTKESVRDMMTQEGTIMTLVNLSDERPAATLKMNVDIAKWLGQALTDQNMGCGTAAGTITAVPPPARQIFLVPWIAPVQGWGNWANIFTRPNGSLVGNMIDTKLPMTQSPVPYDVDNYYQQTVGLLESFCLHYKAQFKTKFYAQKNVDLTAAATNWIGAP